MKQFYKFMPILLFLSISLLPFSLKAQDTLSVSWLNNDETEVLTNSLYETIAGDTTATGERVENRVYKLEKGGFYYITETIQNDGYPLNIVGEKADPNDLAGNPPMLQVTVREDGNTPGNMFNIRGDFTLKNVIVNGKTTLGELKYEDINVRSDGGTFVFDNVTFEYAQWGLLGFYSKDANIYITNSRFRNLVSENEPWGGRAFSNWSDADTIWVENNTFLNVGGFTAQIEGATANFFMFNQNTIVDNGRQLIIMPWVKEAYVTNNLILNGFWQGESKDEISDARLNSTDEQYAGMFTIENIPSDYGLDGERRILIANNAFHLSSTFTDYFEADNDTFNIRKQPLLSGKIENMFAQFDNMKAVGNMMDQGDPGFTVSMDNDQERVDFITDIRNANSPIRLHYWDPGRDASAESIQWPFPEDLTYSSSTYNNAAIGGYHLGDLNWYPSEKATWEGSKQSQYDAIQGMLGGRLESQFLGFVEAEEGTVSGSASVVVPDDKQIANVSASGEITWNVDLDTAGDYDVVLKARTSFEDGDKDADTNNRTTDLVVNEGSPIGVKLGEWQDGKSWSEPVAEDVAFNAGANTIALKKNWGYVQYESVTLLDQSGNEVVTLLVSAATLSDGATYQCGGNLCASADAYVDVTGGGLSLPVSVDNAGDYTVKLVYMAIGGGDPTADLNVNGSLVTNQVFSGADSVFNEVTISGVTMTAGSNTLEVNNVSGSLALDRADLFVLSEVTSIEPPSLPDGFELSQNYPNPFNPSTRINYSIPQATNVQLTVFNILGQKVATLVDGRQFAGSHIVTFDAKSLASGVYFYRLKAGEMMHQRRMTLIK